MTPKNTADVSSDEFRVEYRLDDQQVAFVSIGLALLAEFYYERGEPYRALRIQEFRRWVDYRWIDERCLELREDSS